MRDNAGNVYPTIKIGSQIWMAENLRATYFQNGAVIPYAPSTTQWSQVSGPAYCYYANQSVAGYGALFNWYAVSDLRNIAPPGWHVPTLTEWQTLINNTGGISNAGRTLKHSSSGFWPAGAGTNNYGFGAVPGGERMDVLYQDKGVFGYYWTSTRDLTAFNSAFSVFFYKSSNIANSVAFPFTGGLSIRLIKN
jgi:uncharacterized protein (TIGR02145 family)